MDVYELRKQDVPAYLELLKELDQDQVLSVDAGQELLTKIAGYPFYKVYLVKNDQAQILGTFSLIICDNFGHGGRKFAIIENVVVHPRYIQKGIGKNMMELARTISAEEGCYKLMLSSNQARTGAHAFYESIGFTRHGISFRTELG